MLTHQVFKERIIREDEVKAFETRLSPHQNAAMVRPVLSVVCFLLSAVCYSLSADFCLLFALCCFLCVVYCLLYFLCSVLIDPRIALTLCSTDTKIGQKKQAEDAMTERHKEEVNAQQRSQQASISSAVAPGKQNNHLKV